MALFKKPLGTIVNDTETVGNYKALYYPWMDISHESDEWIKTTALFWDEIYTIVPESIEKPYHSKTAMELVGEGVLHKHIVNHYSNDVRKASKNLIKQMNSSDILRVLSRFDSNDTVPMHMDKFIWKLQNDQTAKIPINIEKMDYNLIDIIRGFGFNISERDRYINVPQSIAHMYMSILADNICENSILKPLTSSSIAKDVLLVARSDYTYIDTAFSELNRHGYPRHEYYSFGQIPIEGMLLDLTIESIRLAENTPVESIIEYKRKYKDELTEFRYFVKEMVDRVKIANSYEEIVNNIREVHQIKIMKALSNLEKSLNGLNITTLPRGLTNLSTVISSSVLLEKFGFSNPLALGVGAGISVIVSMIMYNERKRELIDNSPLAYLYHITH